MAKKSGKHKDKKESHSMNKGAHNTGPGRGSGNKGENWQEGQNWGSGNNNQDWKQGPNDGSGNMNGQPGQFPDMGDLTRSGCLPTFFARIKSFFAGDRRSGCLPKLFIFLLPLLAVSVILFIGL